MENKNLNATVANNSNNVAVAEAANGVNEAANSQVVKTFALTVKRVQTIETDDSFVNVNLITGDPSTSTTSPDLTTKSEKLITAPRALPPCSVTNL